jgi:hypothetical protein
MISRTGAKDVIVFGQVLRAHQRDALAPHEVIAGKTQGPSPRAHCDFSLEDATRFTSLIPGSVEMISTASRWQILGIWKPIKPVHRDPLAFTDSQSVPDSDYRDVVGPKNTASLLKFGGEREHRWHYCSDMTPDEVVLLKHFDSKKDIPARRCAHTSIALPGTESLPARESIEVRALVLF